ncbi:Trp biosynthesis-associated membrane protein [Brachybacterium hainanense]|uniref:Trp biosynthesis-associated membrane protein n=1 Tax=Brachybacterium hainanense TaxID=1541174 RepID=A0ABV6RG48_9MICO
MISRRSAVLAGLALSAGMAGLTRTTWTTASAVDLAGTTRDLDIAGGDVAPGVLALALVGIAASLATSLSSAWIRLVSGPALVLAGLGAAAAAMLVRADPLGTSRSAIAEAVGVVGGEAAAESTLWPLGVLVPAALLVVLGVLVLRGGGAWSRSSRHARATRSAVAVRDVDPAEDPAGVWDALTLGEDPSEELGDEPGSTSRSAPDRGGDGADEGPRSVAQ